jgi:hypothetical protein
MRKWAFIIVILGIFAMALILEFERFEEISSYEDLMNLEVNKKVSLSGKVVEERVLYEGTKLLKLDNGIEVVCECAGGFKDGNVLVEGFVSEYEGKKQVEILRITRTNHEG